MISQQMAVECLFSPLPLNKIAGFLNFLKDRVKFLDEVCTKVTACQSNIVSYTIKLIPFQKKGLSPLGFWAGPHFGF